jgi:hypothetical protein
VHERSCEGLRGRLLGKIRIADGQGDRRTHAWIGLDVPPVEVRVVFRRHTS